MRAGLFGADGQLAFAMPWDAEHMDNSTRKD